MLARLVNCWCYFDLNQRRPQKDHQKNIQNSISRVNFSAEHVPGIKKYKDTDGKRGKAVKVRFYEKLMKKTA